MFSPFERMVAGRYLRARKQEGFVSVIAGFSFAGILLGVMTLIIVMSVMNGFRQELFQRIIGLNGHMNIYSQTGYLTHYDAMAMSVAEIEGVTNVIPVIEGQALLTSSGTASGVVVRGISPDNFRTKPIIADSLDQGNFDDFREGRVGVGVELAKRYRLIPGDQITLVAPKGKASPFGTIPRSRSYTIAVVFDVGMYEYNSGFVYMPLSSAQKFFQYDQSVSGLEILTDRPSDLDDIRRETSLIAEGLAGVQDWRDMNSSFFNALQVERNVMFLILTLIILVAAFNIISSMIMLVKDKGQDIAIMRTMGATRRSMMKIFVLTGASIGFVGTIAGAGLGIAFAANIESIRLWLEDMTDSQLFEAEIYFLSKLPAVIDWNEVVVVIGMAFVLSILATLYPAWRAARMDPVEALRYE